MNFKKLTLLTLVFAMLALMAGAVMAQDDETDADGKRRHPRHRHRIHRAILMSLVDDTGLTPREVREALSDHVTTFADLIAANGGNVDTSIADAVAAGTEVVEKAVEDGRITRERGDEIIEKLPDHVSEFVNNPRPERPDRPNRPPRDTNSDTDSSTDA